MKTIKNLYIALVSIRRDLSRYGVFDSPRLFIVKMFHEPGAVFSIFYRIERYLLFESNYFFHLLGLIIYPFYFLFTYYFLSYHIEPTVEIGGGLLLHNREIVMTENIKIGSNFSCMGQTTIGLNFNTKKAPIVIGNDVLIGVGAKIIASKKLTIASGIVIGANAVVTKSLSRQNAVYGGIPAKFIKYKLT